jgi:DNA-binding SARP family transcriptional activator/predicted ATPase
MTLFITLFGQPRLIFDAQAIRLNAPPKTIPLLAYLLLHRNRVVERQQVAFTLWPDDDETTARSNLRRHVHQLQRSLPPALTDCPWLISGASTVGWNPQADIWLDVAEFENLSANPESLAEAVQLYRGDLLENNYDDWIFFERERLRELYFASLGQLIFYHRTQRNYAAAIGYAQKILARDPCREDALRHLVALRYESGDRAGALQEYEAFTRYLRQEMGVAPMPETQTLHELVLSNARLPGMEPESTYPVELAQPPSQPFLPFVGRTTEMALLAARWSRAARGRGGLLLLGGEAGVGKTRLVREVSLLAEQQGGRVLYGSTTPGEPRPYQAVIEALKSALPLLATLKDEPLRLAALAVIIPELRTRCSLPALPPLEPEKERLRLFDATSACLTKLAGPRPLLLILEDLHWAGESTLALIEFITRRADNLTLLVLGSYREEEAARTHPLRALRRRLQAEKLVEHQALQRLNRQAVEALCAHTDTANLAARLYDVSEGNPLFLNLLLRHWQKTAVLDDAALPQTIQSAVRQRLAQLSPSARSFAEVAAILGPVFDFEASREIGGWHEDQALDALSELLDCQLVRDTIADTEYAFIHHLIQSGLVAQMPPTKRRHRHRRAAEVLEELYPERVAELAGELAVHYDVGGLAERAIPHYLAAARNHLEVFADSEALAALSRAIQLIDENPSNATSSPLFELLLLRESIHHRHGERDEQYADLQRLELLASDDLELACEVLRRRILYHRGKDERLIQKELVEALKAKAEALGSQHWLAEAVFAEGNYRKVADDFPMAITRLQEALALYGELHDSQKQVICCCLLAEIFVILRQSVEAETWAQKALILCDAEQPAYHLMNTLWNLSANGLISKDLERCLTYAQRLLETAEQASDRVWQAAAQRLMGIAYQRQFRITEANQRLQAALELYRLAQKPKGCALTLQSLGHVAAALGNYPTARQHYQQAFDIQERLNDFTGMASEAINLAFTAFFQEDYAAERDFAQRGLALSRQIGNAHLQAMSLQGLGEAASGLGDIATALQSLNEAITLLNDPALVDERAGVLADLAVVQWKTGDLPLALHTIEQVLTHYPQMEGTDDNLHRHLWTAARIMRAAGQPERAGQVLTQAYQAFQKDIVAIPDVVSRQAYAQIRHNRQIIAAQERGEWP